MDLPKLPEEMEKEKKPFGLGIKSSSEKILMKSREAQISSHLRSLSLTDKDSTFIEDFIFLENNHDNEEEMTKFIEVLIAKGKLISTLNFIVKEEVKGNGKSILREESLGSSLLKHYWFHFVGKEYLKTIVYPLVSDICKTAKTKSLEVDPTKIDEGKAKQNLEKILSATKSFLASFFQSANAFPKIFEEVMTTLYHLLTESEGAKKSHLGLGYSEDALRLFGGFLLLRFICPPIVSPKKYGLVKEVPPHAQKALIVVSKIVQSIANQLEFEPTKESFMISANEIIQNSMPQMLTFLNNLMTSIDKANKILKF